MHINCIEVVVVVVVVLKYFFLRQFKDKNFRECFKGLVTQKPII